MTCMRCKGSGRAQDNVGNEYICPQCEGTGKGSSISPVADFHAEHAEEPVNKRGERGGEN